MGKAQVAQEPSVVLRQILTKMGAPVDAKKSMSRVNSSAGAQDVVRVGSGNLVNKHGITECL